MPSTKEVLASVMGSLLLLLLFVTSIKRRKKWQSVDTIDWIKRSLWLDELFWIQNQHAEYEIRTVYIVYFFCLILLCCCLFRPLGKRPILFTYNKWEFLKRKKNFSTFYLIELKLLSTLDGQTWCDGDHPSWKIMETHWSWEHGHVCYGLIKTNF